MPNTAEINLIEWVEITMQGTRKDDTYNSHLMLSRTRLPVGVVITNKKTVNKLCKRCWRVQID